MVYVLSLLYDGHCFDIGMTEQEITEWRASVAGGGKVASLEFLSVDLGKLNGWAITQHPQWKAPNA